MSSPPNFVYFFPVYAAYICMSEGTSNKICQLVTNSTLWKNWLSLSSKPSSIHSFLLVGGNSWIPFQLMLDLNQVLCQQPLLLQVHRYRGFAVVVLVFCFILCPEDTVSIWSLATSGFDILFFSLQTEFLSRW